MGKSCPECPTCPPPPQCPECPACPSYPPPPHLHTEIHFHPMLIGRMYLKNF